MILRDSDLSPVLPGQAPFTGWSYRERQPVPCVHLQHFDIVPRLMPVMREQVDRLRSRAVFMTYSKKCNAFNKSRCDTMLSPVLMFVPHHLILEAIKQISIVLDEIILKSQDGSILV